MSLGSFWGWWKLHYRNEFTMCKYTINHWIVHFNQANILWCKLYLNEAVKNIIFVIILHWQERQRVDFDIQMNLVVGGCRQVLTESQTFYKGNNRCFHVTEEDRAVFTPNRQDICFHPLDDLEICPRSWLWPSTNQTPKLFLIFPV